LRKRLYIYISIIQNYNPSSHKVDFKKSRNIWGLASLLATSDHDA
jgi:hypothetical protein